MAFQEVPEKHHECILGVPILGTVLALILS